MSKQKIITTIGVLFAMFFASKSDFNYLDAFFAIVCTGVSLSGIMFAVKYKK